MARRTLLVIGGGFAGLVIAMRLSGEFDVVLVDFKAYFEYTPGALRAMVRPEHIHRITQQYLDIAHRYHFRFIQGWVEDLTEHNASIRTGDSLQQVSFQFAAICCGSGYSEPIRPRQSEASVPDRLINLEEWREDIRQSQSPVIVGGGTVGVELAGEILAQFPGKQLTLITRDTHLLKELPEAAGAYAYNYLTAKGLQVIFGRVLSEEEQLTHDLVLMCVGIKTQAQFLTTNFSQALDARGAIIVNDHFQMQGCAHIFAVGDCAVTPMAEAKTAYFAVEMAEIAVRNIQALAEDRPLPALPAKTRFPQVCFVSLGPASGVTVFNSLVLAGRLQGWIKDVWERISLSALRVTVSSALLSLGHSSLIVGNKLLG